MIRVRLDGPIDVDGFRQAARRLLSQGVHPEDVAWTTADDGVDLWDQPEPIDSQDGQGGIKRNDDDGSSDAAAPVDASSRLTVPASFLTLCRSALLHREPQRFTLMYRLLWRLKADPDTWRDTLDADRRQAQRLAREVSREIHKTHAFVRFVPVEDGDGERLVAWFEPEHHVLEAAAPFFARRFANLRGTILSPRCSVSWEGGVLRTGPGGRREDAPAPDAGAALWLTYYRSIFNPARLKVAMMEREMPRRYWANLPEAALIEPLIAQAGDRMQDMLEAGPTPARRIRPMAPRRS
ncbi:TIGR03915 family putative DNA repair protein [Mitsuaria sp. GD03876]|uniref:TIGR03915 family putative DNA repair protein n=1 Tax=Mitsuaria sp. GD03876 TaxID=2975399 RepID=UPI00244A0CA8|nr:TIGR03915 family putative DNA repair protein [Mitsuaria sp. GD03876]MDH0867800.1 TIGR03915 family putative DNA repair protein [Mitsuaria sp. GD03876]